MSASQKPQQSGELSKLKELWPKLAESVQGYWQEQFYSKRTQADIRKEMKAKLKIDLQWDDQLTRFRQWLFKQQERDDQAERMQENERRLKEQHPEWSLDQVREEVLRQSYFETLASGNFKLGLATVKQDLNAQKVSIDKRKLALLEKKAEAYDRAQAALTEAKNSKGGLTKETLEKIESELRLL